MDRFNAERIRKTVTLEDFAEVLEALGASVDRAHRHSSCPVHKGTGRDAIHYEERDGARREPEREPRRRPFGE